MPIREFLLRRVRADVGIHLRAGAGVRSVRPRLGSRVKCSPPFGSSARLSSEFESNMRHRSKAPSAVPGSGRGASVSALWACSVPVFRYVEHWAADPYQTVVFHRGPFRAHQSLVRIDTAGIAGRFANVTLRLIVWIRNPTGVLAFWRQWALSLPWLVRGINGTVFGQPPRPVSEPAINSSWTRRPQGDRPALAQGQSAVWVLLECGEPTRPIRREIDRVTLGLPGHGARLPTLDQRDIVNGLVSVAREVKLEFSLLRLSRIDGEQVFVKTLLGTEADLEETGAHRLSIFGRPRPLRARGKGINHGTLDETDSFLIGSCSCQVKELNPGVNLLLAADWGALMKGPQAGTARALPVSADRAASAPVTVTISGNIENGTRANSPKASRLYAILGISIAGVFGVVVLISAGILLSRKK